MGAVGRVAWGANCGGFARVRVFSKKLFGRGGALFGVVWGASGHDEWMRVGPGVAGARHEAGGRWPGRRRRRVWFDKFTTNARRCSANGGRRGTSGVRGGASGEKPAAGGDGRRRTGRRPSKDGIRCRRRPSSGSRNEAAGICGVSCGNIGSIVHCMCTKGNRDGQAQVVSGWWLGKTGSAEDGLVG